MMTKRFIFSQFLPAARRKLALALWLVLCALGASASAQTTVYPTGAWPNDVNNVQAAIDKGGTVVLKAINAAGQFTAFNFGTPEYLPGRNVTINVGVEIIGERMGGHMTTITGGNIPIQSFAQVKTRIVGIDFEGPLFEGINLLASAGSEIVGNRIHAPVPVVVTCCGGLVLSNADGIDVGHFGAPQMVTGMIRIKDNDIEDVVGNSATGVIPFTIAIQADTANANYEITDNTIRNTSNDGIAVVRVQNSSVHIADNRIELGDADGAYSVGIVISGNETVAYEVARNRVLTNVPSPYRDGIVLEGGQANGSGGTVGAFVHDNHVTMHSSQFGGVSLYDLVTNNVLKNNVVDGDGGYALLVSTNGPPTDTASFNRFVDNEIDSFTATVADVFLDVNSLNNVVVGECKSALDLGVGDSVQCGTLSKQSANPPVGLAAQSAAANGLAAKSLRNSVLRSGLTSF